MRAILLLLILALVKPAFAEEDWTKRITPEITLKAIQLYKNDPTTDDALGALSIATNFAEQSEQVFVTIDAKFLPFKLGNIDKDVEARMIGAFVAGNIEYQLMHKIRQDSPLEGILLELYTYKKLKEKGLFPENDNFEKWLQWEKEGELRQRLKM